MKKQIAVLMAAATAVTTVAPVLANAEVKEVSGVTASEVSAKIKEALNTKYADKTQDGINASNPTEVDSYLNSRYAVFVSVNGAKPAINEADGLLDVDVQVNGKDHPYKDKFFEGVDLTKVAVVTDANKVVKFIEKESINSTGKVKVFIVDKGIKDNSSIFKTNKKVYVKGNANETDTEVSIEKTYDGIKDKKFVDSIDYVKDSNKTKIELKLKSGEKLNFGVGNEAYDFEKALDKNGKSLVLDDSADQSVYDQVAKFEMKDNADGKMYSFDLPSGDTVVYSVDDAEKATIEMSDVFTEDTGYTKKGADFVNKLINANNDKDKVTFNHAGITYKLKENINFNDAKIEKDGDKYVLKFTAKVIDKNDNVEKILKFVVEGKTQKDLARVLKDFKAGKEVVAGYFTKLAGSNRYATAIEISKETFNKDEDGRDVKADTVVIVGGNALLDGLSAGPLATAKNAPILLADAKSGLNNDTLNEIDRVCENLKNKTVYIVGGDSSVPKSVEKQLKDKFGAVVVRISGKDRYETSLDVAKKLKYEDAIKDNPDLYLVGGEGAADAMSISGVASKFTEAGANKRKVEGPVLVVPKDAISRNTREYLKAQKFENAYFIGGDSSLSTNVYKTPDLANRKERVSGKDRFETNVEILKRFYNSNPDNVKGAIFASGDNNYLVDAQTSAVLSVAKKAPVVLTDKKLTDSQTELFKDGAILSKANVNKNVYQIGGVVSADVMKVVVDKLGL